MISMQVQTPGSSSRKVARIFPYGDPELDEEIIIPSYESITLTIEKINEIQGALDRRKRQEVLRREYKYRQALNEIKDIFMDAFSLQSPDETRPIVEQLSDIVDQVTNEDHDTNVKLMEWSERKFQGKVNEKISSGIALEQVELAKTIDKAKIVLENIFSLYRKLCDFSNFTQEINQRIMILERNLKISSMQLARDPA